MKLLFIIATLFMIYLLFISGFFFGNRTGVSRLDSLKGEAIELGVAEYFFEDEQKIFRWKKPLSLNNLKKISYTDSSYEKDSIFLKPDFIKRKVLKKHYFTIKKLYENSKLEEALEKLGQTKILLFNIFTEDHLNCAPFYQLEGDIFYKQKKYYQSFSIYKKLLELYKSNLSDDHLKVAEVLNRIATILSEMGKFEEALIYYKETLNILENNLSPSNASFAKFLNDTGKTFFLKGEVDKAEKLFQSSIIIYQLGYGMDALYLTVPLNNLAKLYGNKRMYLKAIEKNKRILYLYRENYGPNNYYSLLIYLELARLFEEIEDYKKSLIYYELHLNLLTVLCGENEDELAPVLKSLIRVSKKAGNNQKLEAILKRLKKITKKRK